MSVKNLQSTEANPREAAGHVITEQELCKALTRTTTRNAKEARWTRLMGF